jgi:YcaO-like protein with predicted kinase domain
MISDSPAGEGPISKGYRLGSHRTADPEETLDRVRPYMADMGITRIANVTGLDSLGIPVVVVARPNSRNLAVAQGKGPSLAAAQASGLMESVEFYHAERIALPLRLATYRDLAAHHAVVDPHQLPRIATRPFEPTMRLLWVAGRELGSAREVWVPYELVHMDYTLPLPEGSGCFLMS